MQKAPSIEEISKWLRSNDPLGSFAKGEFRITDIDPKPYSGHFNFLLEVGVERMVLRFKGPEWGDQKRGTRTEYEVLTYVEPYTVAPRPLYSTGDFFGESALLEEYVKGESIGNIYDDAASIARFFSNIARIPVKKGAAFFEEPMKSYERNRKTWKARLLVAAEESRAAVWSTRIADELLPQAERMLDAFEPRLEKTINNYGETFIFESAHIGHLLKTSDGFRFLNWEQVSYGDPAFMLAVFLTSIKSRNDFEVIKGKMLEAYPIKMPREEFETLVGERMKERAVSNLIWGLWTHARKGELDSQSVGKEFDEVMEILSTY
ncbi:MAG: phosphotransferase [Parcubacteria group bacterium]|nr:phosphotransferase [Parcubacteria group bacterium]